MKPRMALRLMLCCALVGFVFIVPEYPSADSNDGISPAASRYGEVREGIPFVLPESPVITCRLSPGVPPFQAGPMEEELRDGIPRQDWTQLTVAERMLAFGWKNPKAGDFWRLSREERREYFTKEENLATRTWAIPQFDPVGDTFKLWWQVLTSQVKDADTIDELFDMSLRGNACRDRNHRFVEDYLTMHTSPVTGKLIEFKCREFSPGDMYIAFVPEEVVERHHDFLSGLWEPHVRPEPEDIVYVYYRVYGTTGIIRTGLFWGRPNGMILGRT